LPSKPDSWIRRLWPPAEYPGNEPFAWLRFLHAPIALAGVAWLDPHQWVLYVSLLVLLTLLWPFHLQLTEGVEIYPPASWTSAAAAYFLGPALLPIFWVSSSTGFALIVALDVTGIIPATGITADSVRQVRGLPFPPGSNVDGNLRHFVNTSSHAVRAAVATAAHRFAPGLPLLALVFVGEAAVALWLEILPIPGRTAPKLTRARFVAALGSDFRFAAILLQVGMVWFLAMVFYDGGMLAFALGALSTFNLFAIMKRLNDTRLESERQRLALVEVRDELGRRQRLAAIGQTASGIFHQIARHHGAIGMFAHLLGQEAANGNGGDPEHTRAAVREHAARILESVEDAKHVIESLRRFGQDRTLNLYPQSVLSLLAECVDECRARATPLGVQVTVTAPADVVVALDKHKIKQALGNLLDNAIEVTEAGAAVDVRVMAADGAIRIVVRDHGPGVAARMRDRLFTPFSTTKPDGVGLGLALARELVEAHGGRIEWEPATPGTSFVVTLPVG